MRDFKSYITNTIAKEGWRPGLKYAECHLACDTSGPLAGELNGKPISCIRVTKYGKALLSVDVIRQQTSISERRDMD